MAANHFILLMLQLPDTCLNHLGPQFLPPMQTKKYTSGLEARVADLEAAVARLNSKS